jgi:hypothetical protein
VVQTGGQQQQAQPVGGLLFQPAALEANAAAGPQLQERADQLLALPDVDRQNISSARRYVHRIPSKKGSRV